MMMEHKFKCGIVLFFCGLGFGSLKVGLAHQQRNGIPPLQRVKLQQNLHRLRESYYLIRESIANQTVQQVAYFYHDLWRKSNDKKTGVLFAFAHEMAVEPSFFTPLTTQQQQMMMQLQEVRLSEEATQAWAEGLKAFPDSAEVALFNAYRLANHIETIPQSVSEARRAVRLDPKWAFAYRILANNLIVQMDTEQDKAKKPKLLQEAYQMMLLGQHLDEKSISKLFASTVYARRGEYKTALVYLDQAIAQQSNNLSQQKKDQLQNMRKGLLSKIATR